MTKSTFTHDHPGPVPAQRTVAIILRATRDKTRTGAVGRRLLHGLGSACRRRTRGRRARHIVLFYRSGQRRQQRHGVAWQRLRARHSPRVGLEKAPISRPPRLLQARVPTCAVDCSAAKSNQGRRLVYWKETQRAGEDASHGRGSVDMPGSCAKPLAVRLVTDDESPSSLLLFLLSTHHSLFLLPRLLSFFSSPRKPRRFLSPASLAPPALPLRPWACLKLSVTGTI